MRSSTWFASSLIVSLLSLPTARLDAQVWEVGNRLLVPMVTQAQAEFGGALAVGDFDGDGTKDLAVGADRYDFPGHADNGALTIYWGSVGQGLVLYVTMTFVGGSDREVGHALVAGDFDGDGRDELAIGEPHMDIVAGSTIPAAGGVAILRWDPVGEFFDKVQELSQLQTTAFSIPEPADRFGSTLAAGDFNGDGWDDLAIGVPDEDWSASVDVGIVHVFYGSADLLRTDNVSHLMSASRTNGERFGDALATGDFAGGGFDDLAVGAPRRQVAGKANAGAVELYFGSATGVHVAEVQLLTDASFGRIPELGDRFGGALAAADFDRGGLNCSVFECYDDLAIGVPGQALGANASAGFVIVGYGAPGGLSTAQATFLTQSSVGETIESADEFGASLAAGELDPRRLGWSGDGADLVIGAPHENGDGDVWLDEGVVHLVFGSESGLNHGQASQLLRQKPGFAVSPPALGDLWGSALAIGDFDGDGWGDLASSALLKDLPGGTDSGVVQVLRGALFADGFECSGTGEW